MAKKTFQCSVVTPEHAVLEADDATYVALPAHDGEQGIMHGRAPLLCQLGIGVLRVETESEKHVFFIDRGFAQMADNKLTILTEQAKRPAEVDRDEAAKALSDARAMPSSGGEDVYSDPRMVAITAAQMQLKVADKNVN